MTMKKRKVKLFIMYRAAFDSELKVLVYLEVWALLLALLGAV